MNVSELLAVELIAILVNGVVSLFILHNKILYLIVGLCIIFSGAIYILNDPVSAPPDEYEGEKG